MAARNEERPTLFTREQADRIREALRVGRKEQGGPDPTSEEINAVFREVASIAIGSALLESLLADGSTGWIDLVNGKVLWGGDI